MHCFIQNNMKAVLSAWNLFSFIFVSLALVVCMHVCIQSDALLKVALVILNGTP